MFDEINTFLLQLPEVSIELHFKKISYRVRKKIVATFDEHTFRYCVKLSLIDQEMYSILNTDGVEIVPNKWGKIGWTFLDSEYLELEEMKEILLKAYRVVAPKKLSMGI